MEDAEESWQDVLERKKNTPLSVASISLQGNSRTNADFLRAQFRGVQGARSLKELLQEVEDVAGSLEQQSVFEHATIRCAPAPRAGEVAVEVSVVEQPRASLQTSTYVQKGRTTLEACYSRKNLFGKFERLDLSFAVGNDTSNALNLSVSKPDVFRTGVASALRLFHNTQVNQHIQSHNLVCSGLSVALTSPARRHSPYSHTLSFGHTVRAVQELAAHASDGIRHAAGDSSKTSVELKVARDTRNDSVVPSSGSLLQCVAELAHVQGRGDSFGKAVADAKVFFQPFKNSGAVVGVESQVGYIHSLSERVQPVVPLPDRFVLGGSDSLRGFHVNSVGPSSPRKLEGNAPSDAPLVDPVGGELMATAVAHVSAPFSQSWLAALNARGHLFCNVGSLVKRRHEQTLSADVQGLVNGVHASCGAGLVVPVQYGRMELNWCVPVAHPGACSAAAVQFGLSKSFL